MWRRPTVGPADALGLVSDQAVPPVDENFLYPIPVRVKVECATLAEVEEALAAGVPRLLLDNMSPARLREAVELVAGRASLEASGGMRGSSSA